MFKNYLAAETDLETIEEGLKTVWKPELNFVFRKKKLIASTVVVSYDSKHLYLWVPLRGKLGQYRLQKIPHRLAIPDQYQMGWAAGTYPEIEKSLPESIRNSSVFMIPRISGSLVHSFIASQKNRKLLLNPHISRESYLATIVHEFGHVYWDQHKLWWYSNKEENLSLLRTAIKLFSQNHSRVSHISIHLPFPLGLGETFAFCTEYYASTIFWPRYKQALDRFIHNCLKTLLSTEELKNLEKEISDIEPNANYPHYFSFILGKVLLLCYPTTWPRLLTSKHPLITVKPN